MAEKQVIDTYQNKKESRERAMESKSIAFRRSIFSLMPHIVGCFLITWVMYSIAAGLLTTLDTFGLSRVWLRLLAIIPALVILNTIRIYFNNRYIIGRQRLRLYRGLLALSLDKPAIDYSDIREIQVTQNFFGRIFNYGHVAVGTAASGTYDIILENIGQPYAIQKLLDERRRLRQLKVQSAVRTGAE